MYKCRHFAIHELVPPGVYSDRGEKAWQLLNPDMLQTIDAMRDRYGPMTINNYMFGGNRKESGLRVPGCDHYRPYSQHSLGNAFDAVFKLVSAEEVRQDILKGGIQLPHLHGMELDISWFHGDCRNADGLVTFKP